jgi:aminoglycoside 3-N-acetyltransferase
MTRAFDSYYDFFEKIDPDWLMETTRQLWQIELGQTFRNYRQSAEFAEGLLKRQGLSDVKRVTFPADGKSTFFEAITPIGWDANVGRLEAVNCLQNFSDPVLADMQRHPFHLLKGSTATPPEGIVTRLITEQQMYNGADVRGKMVLLNADMAPKYSLAAMVELGAIGFVSDYLPSRYVTPDGIHWANGTTPGSHWHNAAEDFPYFGFMVTPRMGDIIRRVANTNKLMVKALSDGRRFESTVDVVTGVIPGRQKMEFWLQAHLYEPLPDDNSSGAAAAVAIAKAIADLAAAGKIAKPEFTIRVVLGMEFYGFAAYASLLGKDVPNKVIGAINLDGFPHVHGCTHASMDASPAGSPFFGDYMFKQLFDNCVKENRLSIKNFTDHGRYSDDMSLCDSSSKLRTVWLMGDGPLWHNSKQTMEYIDPAMFREAVAVQATFIAEVVGLDAKAAEVAIPQAGTMARQNLQDEFDSILSGMKEADDGIKAAYAQQAKKHLLYRLEREEARLRDFARVCQSKEIENQVALLNQEYRKLETDLTAKLAACTPKDANIAIDPDQRWADYASGIMCTRLTQGMLQDFTRIPKDKRHRVRESKARGIMTWLLARLDGQRNLLEAFERVRWDLGTKRGVLDNSSLRSIVGGLEFLSQYGYVDIKYPHTLTKDDLVQALRRSGVVAGDLIFVHSSLSEFGHIEGGDATALSALREAIGPKGTMLMPAFTTSAVLIAGDPVTDRRARPFDHANISRVNTGQLCQALLGQADVIRSRHPSHSVAGVGPLAKELLADQKEGDSPNGSSSAFAKLHANGGKIVYFGASPRSTTFLHYLEDCLDLPYLTTALCMIQNDDGSPRPVLIPRFPSGHREFYGRDWRQTKTFKTLLASGLNVNTTPVGLGEIKLIQASQLYELGLAALKQDPMLMMDDKPKSNG